MAICNRAISLAESIWIAGYSFPQTDTFMQRLLHEGLSANPGLEWLSIANIRAKLSGNSGSLHC